MALTQKVKVSLYEKRPYDLEIKQGPKAGEKRAGYLYKGFKQNESTISFSSPNNIDVHDLGAYDDALAVEFTLFGKEYKGEVKWSTQRPE